MSTLFRIALAVAVVALAAGAGASLANSTPQGRPSPSSAQAGAGVGTSGGGPARTISAIAKGTGITLIDADRNGERSLGDYELGTTVYLDSESSKPLGHGSIVCTQTNTAGTAYQCQGVTHFAAGDLATAGLFIATAKTYSLAIVGGTGVYAGARGVLRGTWLDAKFTRSRVVFTLAS